MQNPKGSYYSAFVWKFANSQENAFEDFILAPFDVGYVIICVLFVSFGACGMYLNAKNIYEFWRLKTVSSTFLFVILKFNDMNHFYAGVIEKSYLIFCFFDLGEKSI